MPIAMLNNNWIFKINRLKKRPTKNNIIFNTCEEHNRNINLLMWLLSKLQNGCGVNYNVKFRREFHLYYILV